MRCHTQQAVRSTRWGAHVARLEACCQLVVLRRVARQDLVPRLHQLLGLRIVGVQGELQHEAGAVLRLLHPQQAAVRGRWLGAHLHSRTAKSDRHLV